LIRFDDLEEHKLIRHIENLIIDELNIKLSRRLEDTILRKSNNSDVNYSHPLIETPLLVINGYPFMYMDILKYLKLIEVNAVITVSKVDELNLFGEAARKGIVRLWVSPTKFKKALYLLEKEG
jgi:hypothetical protein